jgi:hypothetical protein
MVGVYQVKTKNTSKNLLNSIISLTARCLFLVDFAEIVCWKNWANSTCCCLEKKRMARQKRTSPVLEKAERRAAGMKSLRVELNFGNSRSLPSFLEAIEQMREKQDAYNQLLSSVDTAYVEMLEFEKALADLTDHMLLDVASRFGRNSSEYEAAGGMRKSEQIRRRSRGKRNNRETEPQD